MNKGATKVMGVLRAWGLIIAMLAGVGAYVLYAVTDVPLPVRVAMADIVAVAQPLLIFLMLFLTFCRIDMSSMRLRRWHLWLLLIQGGVFSVIAVMLAMMPHSPLRIVLEGAMICLICPTATAAPVITRRLGGDITSVTTYTIFVNLMAAVLIPALLPMVHPIPGVTTIGASFMILSKVMPLLILPLLCAAFLKWGAPKVHDVVAKWVEVSFYLWLVSLALAIGVTARSLCRTQVSGATIVGLIVISLVCCLLQFYVGRKIGKVYGDTVTAGQALGQKNTVFAIWLGYTFFTPVTSVVGGFYSIWHNLVNQWQLYRHEHHKR